MYTYGNLIYFCVILYRIISQFSILETAACCQDSVSWCTVSWCTVSWCTVSYVPSADVLSADVLSAMYCQLKYYQLCIVSLCTVSLCTVSWCTLSYELSALYCQLCTVSWCTVSWWTVSWCNFTSVLPYFLPANNVRSLLNKPFSITTLRCVLSVWPSSCIQLFSENFPMNQFSCRL